MEVLEENSNRTAQLWTRRSEKSHSARVDYRNELRSWVQRAIFEAEKNRNFEKKNRFLSLLKEL